MKIFRSALVAIALSTAMVGASIPTAQACGVIGCLVNKVAPGVGTALDHANAAAGKPFDHAVTATMNTFVPGSGTAVEGYWAARDAGLVPNIPNGGFRAASNPAAAVPIQPAVILGNFCSTPVGRFGPGPVNPVGVTCNITLWNGQMVLGQVTQ